jgi:hypothetical protein
MFAAEPRRFLTATQAAEGGEMRSSNFKNIPPRNFLQPYWLALPKSPDFYTIL